MTRSLELHDSVVVGLDGAPDGLRIRLAGYIHQWERGDDGWRGTGHVQPVVVTLSGAAGLDSRDLPLRISDGILLVDGVPNEDLIVLPFKALGRIRLELVFDDGSRLESGGEQIAIEPLGEGRFVEELPAEFAPDK